VFANKKNYLLTKMCGVAVVKMQV